MIISRTPTRITLGGGGTDLPEYSSKFGGTVISAAINKFVYVVVKKHFENTIRFSGYHHKEVAKGPEDIKHPVVREALQMLHIGCGIEIVSLADVPANVGLGTSSGFTVGLLNALHTYKNEYCLDSLLADEAVHLEREVLRESGGIQDQYISAYGGMQVIEIDTDGTIMVNPLGISDNNIELLESKLVFFYTNIQRVAKDIQSKHVKAIQSNEILNNLHQIKAIGEASKYALEAGDVDDYGKYMNEHWIAKHGMQRGVSNGDIDKWYNMAMDAGATGGKLCGAGGGGFLLFHCPDGKNKIREVLTKEGLKELPFKFERIGSRITLNI